MPIKKYYQKNKEHYREYNKQYYLKNKKEIDKQKPKYNKRYYEKNKKEIIKRNKEYVKTHISEVRIARRRRQKRYALNNPEKIIAQSKAKKIKIKNKCEICGSKKRLQRHHWRYDKPLIINTLCGYCHNVQHNQVLKEI